MIVVDAHVWVWWLHDPSTLTATARRADQEKWLAMKTF